MLKDAEAALSNLEVKQRGAVIEAETAIQKEDQVRISSSPCARVPCMAVSSHEGSCSASHMIWCLCTLQGGQRLKDLNERLSIEQTKLRKVLENVSALQMIKESTSGNELLDTCLSAHFSAFPSPVPIVFILLRCRL